MHTVHPALAVRRLEVRCLVPQGHPQPERVRDRVAALARSALPGALRDALAPLLAGRDGLWVVRRLEVELAMDVDADGDALARRWAAALSRALLDAWGDADADTVQHFADRADHLARHLDALAAGGGESWCFAAFDGLRLLPTPARLRSVIAAEPAEALRALGRLAPESFERLVEALGRVEAARVLQVLCAVEPTAPADPPAARQAAQAVLLALERGAVVAVPAGADAPDTLRLFVAAHRADPRAGGAALREACEAALAWRVHSADARRRRPVAAATVEASLRAAGFDAACRARLRALLPAPAAVAPAGPHAPRPTRLYTRHGGALLLLPSLAAWPLDALCASLPNAGDAGAAAVLRWLVLGTALGDGAPPSVFDDPVLRLLCRLPDDWSDAAARRWQRALSQDACERLQRAFTAWSLARSDASTAPPAIFDTRGPGGPVRIVLDPQRGRWLQVARRAAGDAPPAAEPAAPAGDHAEPGDDYDALVSAARCIATGRQRRLLALLARGLLHDFAWRLPGFAQASVRHLRRNFLAIDAELEFGAERCIARLGHAPLDVLLSITGAKRRDVRLPWWGDRTLALYPAE